MNRALLVGINSYPEQPLRGCVNDVRDMAAFLVARCGFDPSDIRLVLDGEATTRTIREGLSSLVAGLSRGDRVVFHYSGHGGQVPVSTNAVEHDWRDEVICPIDFDWYDDNRIIRDKEFARIFAAIPVGVEFVWISDSCSSGDLSRLAAPPEGTAIRALCPPADVQAALSAARSKGARPLGMAGVARAARHFALLAACAENQRAADSEFWDGVGRRPNGAFTYTLLQVLGEKPWLEAPLKRVMGRVRHELKQRFFDQVPQIEGSRAVAGRAFLDCAHLLV